MTETAAKLDIVKQNASSSFMQRQVVKHNLWVLNAFFNNYKDLLTQSIGTKFTKVIITPLEATLVATGSATSPLKILVEAGPKYRLAGPSLGLILDPL